MAGSSQRVDHTEPQKNHQQAIHTDTDLWVESSKQDSEGMSICNSTCNINTKNFSYTCMWLHPQFSFMSSQPQTQTRASMLLDGTASIREGCKLWAVMGISFTVQWCRAAALYTVKPVVQNPSFKNKREKLVGGSALRTFRL